MKRALSLLMISVILSVACIAYSDETAFGETLGIRDNLSFPDGYDIDRYIIKPNIPIQLDDLVITLTEAAADPHRLHTVFRCECSDPDVELRWWHGYDFDLPEVLEHLKESVDHRILYISIEPKSPYQEEAMDDTLQDNVLYYWSGSYASYDDLAKCETNKQYTVEELCTISIIRMDNRKWTQETTEVSLDIPVWPVIDSFEYPVPADLPQYGIVINRAAVYLTPLAVYEDIKANRYDYDIRIKGDPEIKLAEKLPDTMTLVITDDSRETVYSEEWIRENGRNYERVSVNDNKQH